MLRWRMGRRGQEVEPDVPRDLRKIGDRVNVSGGGPSRDQGGLCRVGPDLSTPGRCRVLERRGRAEPGSKKPEVADGSSVFWALSFPPILLPSHPVCVRRKPGDGAGGHVPPCIPQEEPEGAPHSGRVCHLLLCRARHAHRGEGPGAVEVGTRGRRRSQAPGLQGPGTPSLPSHSQHQVGEAFLCPGNTSHPPLGAAEGWFGSTVS